MIFCLQRPLGDILPPLGGIFIGHIPWQVFCPIITFRMSSIVMYLRESLLTLILLKEVLKLLVCMRFACPLRVFKCIDELYIMRPLGCYHPIEYLKYLGPLRFILSMEVSCRKIPLGYLQFATDPR